MKPNLGAIPIIHLNPCVYLPRPWASPFTWDLRQNCWMMNAASSLGWGGRGLERKGETGIEPGTQLWVEEHEGVAGGQKILHAQGGPG